MHSIEISTFQSFRNNVKHNITTTNATRTSTIFKQEYVMTKLFRTKYLIAVPKNNHIRIIIMYICIVLLHENMYFARL